MSSGGGRKVAAAENPPSVPIITSAESLRPASGIKILINRGKVGVTSSPAQPTALQNPVSVAGGNASVSTIPELYTPATVAQGNTQGGEMRVKVTGEDTHRNSPAASHGQQYTNSLLGRRFSITQRLIPSQRMEINNGQESVAPQYIICSTADGKSSAQMKVISSSTSWSNIAKSSAEKPLPVAAHVAATAVTVAQSGPSDGVDSSLPATKTLNTQISVAESTNVLGAVVQGNGMQMDGSGKIETAADRATNKAAVALALATAQSLSQHHPMADQIEVVTIAMPIHSDERQSDTVVQSVVESAKPDGRVQDEAQQPCTSSDPTAETASDSAGELQAESKPSREMKLLKETHVKSKVLTEFISEASLKGKLRKRRTDSAGGGVPVPSADSGPSPPTHSGQRKRQRSRSVANPATNSESGHIGLEIESNNGLSVRADEVGLLRSSNSGRKGRPPKSEISLIKRYATGRSESSVSKDDENVMGHSISLAIHQQTKKVPGDPPKPGWDRFCWRCKKTDTDLACGKCVRSYHKACKRYTMDDPNWSCPECKTTAISTRADAGFFLESLGYALDILTAEFGHTFNPLDRTKLEHYDSYITHHMDLSVMYERLNRRGYKALEEFLSDLNWIVHNMSIYNMTGQTELLQAAQDLQKRGKHEIEELEPCFECYNNANSTGEHWFTEPCRKPHLLVWAKLRGYPYWPGKLYDINASNQAHVRFFDQHDRAWLPLKDCFIFSERDPNPPSQKSRHGGNFKRSIMAVERHIERLREAFQIFNYAEGFQLVDPARKEEQLRAMLPKAFVEKVLIRRSDGEMVAVASSSEGAHSLAKAKEGSEMVTQKAATSTKDKQTNPGKTGSSGKPLTRRMSKYVRKSEEPVAEGSKDSANGGVSDVSLISNDTTSESNVTGGKSVDGKKHKLSNRDEESKDPNELSLVLRRGLYSWETEPLCKRRKSSATKKATDVKTTQPDKEKLPTEQQMETATATATTTEVEQKETEQSANHLPETSTVASHIQTSTTVASKDAEKRSVDASGTCVPKNMVVVSIPADTTPGSSKGTTEEIGETPSSMTISSTASSTLKTSSESEITIKEEILSDDESCTVTQAKSHVHSAPSSVDKLRAQTSTAEKSSVSLPGSKIVHTDTTVTAATTDTANKITAISVSSVAKAGGSNNAKPIPSNQLAKPKESGKTVAVMMPAANKTRTAAVSNTSKSDSTVTAAAVTVVPKLQLQAALPANATRPESNSIGAIVAPVETGVNQPALPVTTIPKANVSGSTNAISVAPSNQRARKSFPGGAANAKNVAKQPTTQSAASIPVPASISSVSIVQKSPIQSMPMDKASENVMAVAAVSRDANQPLPGTMIVKPSSVPPPPLAYRGVDFLNRSSTTVNSNSAVIVSKPPLIPASTTISLVSCTEERDKSTNEALAAAPIDEENDDIMIIEEESTQQQVASRSLPLPPLVPKPHLHSARDQSTDSGDSVRPSDLLNDYAGQLTESFSTMMENLLTELAGKGLPSAEVSMLKIKLDRALKQNERLADELETQRKKHESMMQDLRQSLEQDKLRALSEQQKQLGHEKQRAVQLAKQKQWCKRCYREAQFYCCWNTSYCEESCREKHWEDHKDVCVQVKDKKPPSGLPTSTSMVSAVPNHCRNEDARQLIAIPASTSVTVSPESKRNVRKNTAAAATAAANAAAAAAATVIATAATVSARGIASPDNGGRKNFAYNPARASPSARGADPNNLNSSIPNNGVIPIATSTPFPSVTRSHTTGSVTSSATVSYTTPIIKAVHGGDSVLAYQQQHAGQNGGGNVSIGASSSSTPNLSQPQKPMAAASRNKPTQSHNRTERRDNAAALKVSQGFVPTNTYDLTLSPVRSTAVLQPAASITIRSAAANPPQNRASAVGDNAIVFPTTWSQMSIEKSGIRRTQSGIIGTSGQPGISVGAFRITPHNTKFPSQKQKSAQEQ